MQTNLAVAYEAGFWAVAVTLPIETYYWFSVGRYIAQLPKHSAVRAGDLGVSEGVQRRIPAFHLDQVGQGNLENAKESLGTN